MLDLEVLSGNSGGGGLGQDLLAVIGAAGSAGAENGGGGVLQIHTANGSHHLRLVAATEVQFGRPCAECGKAGAAARTLEVRFGFTRKEARVAQLLAEGRPNKEIARVLFVSPHTARHHIQHVMLKLGVSSRTAAAIRIVSS